MIALMTKAATSYPGGCLCGAVRFVATGAPLWVVHCHCQSCRRCTGSPFTTFAGFAVEQVAFRAAAPAVYTSSPGVRRSFCGACGTPVAFEADRYPGEIHLYVGTLDAPEDLPPQAHVHASEQLSWLLLDDGLRRFRTTGTKAS
jgi:hypothetical protein